MVCTGLVDEPSAANAVLGLRDGVVVDVGGGTTGIAVVRDGEVVHTADEATGVEELRKRGMTVITKIDTAAFQAALKPAYEAYAKDLDGALIERIRTWKPN